MGSDETTQSLTLDEILKGSSARLNRTFIFEQDNGEEMQRDVTFRRLTYQEITDLALIPTAEDARYTRTVVFLASLEPKFEDADQVGKTPHGFVQHYSKLILDESGKDPFLVKR